MAANCGNCGQKRNALIHSRGDCEYVDPSKAGLSPIGRAREKYLQSEEHKRVYEEAKSDLCLGHMAGAPGPCGGGLVPHHIAGRGAFGGQRASERDYPVVTICAYLNSAIEDDLQTQRWAERTTWERDGVIYPFRVRTTSKRRQEIEL